jgi:hypothetical protein
VQLDGYKNGNGTNNTADDATATGNNAITAIMDANQAEMKAIYTYIYVYIYIVPGLLGKSPSVS